MIRLKCPSCARPLGIDEAYVGLQGLCPGCHTTFVVPAPAVLLDGSAQAGGAVEAPAHRGETLEPLQEKAFGPADEPLLPEGPVGLLPEEGVSAAARPTGFPSMDLSLEDLPRTDPWALTERPLASQPPPLPLDAMASPEELAALDLPTLDAAVLLPEPAAWPPPGPPPLPTDWERLGLPDPLAVTTPATPPRLEGAPGPESAPALVRDKVLMPVSLSPFDAAQAYGLAHPEPPPLPLAAPVPAPQAEPPAGMGRIRKRRSRSAGPLIPGLDDFYLGLGTLGLLWLVLLVVVLKAPTLFWLPILAGVMVWGAGGVDARVKLRDDDPNFWVKVALVPVAIFVRGVARRKILGPLVIGVAGLVLVVTGVLAAARHFREDPLANFPPPQMEEGHF